MIKTANGNDSGSRLTSSRPASLHVVLSERGSAGNLRRISGSLIAANWKYQKYILFVPCDVKRFGIRNPKQGSLAKAEENILLYCKIHTRDHLTFCLNRLVFGELPSTNFYGAIYQQCIYVVCISLPRIVGWTEKNRLTSFEISSSSSSFLKFSSKNPNRSPLTESRSSERNPVGWRNSIPRQDLEQPLRGTRGVIYDTM